MSGAAGARAPTGDSWVPSQALVACQGVSRSFVRGGQEIIAVRAATLAVPAGARVAVTGRSGSGKSTLLHLLAGLEAPTAGAVCWPALGGSPRGRPEAAGVVFQSPSLLSVLDVAENVTLPLVLAGVSAGEAHARAADALRRLDLDGLMRSLPDELSAGQAQKVALARVLASRPRLILADEPTGRLDHLSTRQVVAVLMETVEQLGAALVVATHDPSLAQRCTTHWHINDGELATAAGEPANPRQSPQ